MFRGRFFIRGLILTVLVLGLVATGSYFAYQAGLVQGADLDGAYVMPHAGEEGMPVYGRGYYGHGIGFGFFPFLFFGGIFNLLFFFLLIGMFFRLMFMPWRLRRYRWHGGPDFHDKWGPRGRWIWEEGDEDESDTDPETGDDAAVDA
mgnify:CR=1 FL=1